MQIIVKKLLILSLKGFHILFQALYFSNICQLQNKKEKGHRKMIRYLSRIFLIACVQIFLVTGLALAANTEVAEIIRSKVEQIRTTQTLQIDDVPIASITVLPELYENNEFQRLLTNSRNVSNYDPGSVPAPLLIPRF